MRRDDDVEIPSLTLDQDEVSERRPNMATPKARSIPTQVQPKHAPNVVHKKANLLGVYSLIVVVLLAVAGGGFWLWQQNMQLRHEVYGAKTEIQNLDHQLLAADVSANKQGQTLEETLKEHDSEIRKLWAVAYDRNRTAIANNNKAIEVLEKQVASLKETLSVQSKRIAIQSDTFNDIEAGYNKLVPNVASLDSAVKNVTALQEQQSTSLNEVGSKIIAQEEQVEALDSSVVSQTAVLSKIQQELVVLQSEVAAFDDKTANISDADLVTVKQTLASHQDAIDSSDAFRTQVNSEIIRLRKQINQLMLEQQLNAE
ncbi:hypothetical protein ABFY09_05130 [Marinomonas sp. 5E14-1]|uniref:hypothetical protein n=1 Tax=Marinomonas sp. 5E14-1 TaxID=3153922 RepID=UPI003263E5EB